MKSVLISIRPKWCELIASGKKTVEVRKTRPKIETPFKCYIYETKDSKYKDIGVAGHRSDGTPYIFVNAIGKVIGEFVCDRIIGTCLWRLKGETGWCAKRTEEETYLPNNTCLTMVEIEQYAGSRGRGIYGWHISDLVIYDEPKELGEFIKPCDTPYQCDTCKDLVRHFGCGRTILKPPQSWCYVEGE